MKRILGFLRLWLLCTTIASSAFAQTPQPTVEQVRATLAGVLKKDAAKLPADKPVAELGVDELSVVEWQMATEKAFRVRIADERLFDPKTMVIRKDLTISSMTQIVRTSPPWPAGKVR